MIRRLASKTFVFRSFVAGLLFSLLVIPAAVLAERSVNTSTSLRTLDTSSEETRRTNKRPVARPSVQMSVTNNYKQTGNPQTISTKVAELTESKNNLRSVQTAMQNHCNNEVVVTVLGKEITYGAGGPDVPVRVDFQLGDNPVQNLFGGENVEVGDSTIVDIGDGGEELKFIGRSAYPSFDNPTLVNYVIENSHANNALILLDGNNLEQQIASKGANGPFGGQIPIDEIIEEHLEGGMVDLPETDQLILFELGTLNQGSAAYDLQDLVLLVEHNCDVGQSDVVSVLNRIDPANSGAMGCANPSNCTQLMGGANFTKPTGIGGDAYHNPGVIWTQQEDGKLHSIRAIIYGSYNPQQGQQYGDPYTSWSDFAQWQYYVHGWEGGFEAFEAQPATGNLFSTGMMVPENSPFGVTGPGGSWTTFEVVFPLSSHNIQLQAGETYIIGLKAVGHVGSLGTVRHNFSMFNNPVDVTASHTLAPVFMNEPPLEWAFPRLGAEVFVEVSQ